MLSPEQLPERGDTAVRNATWNNELKIFEPGVDVECEPVARDPARDAHADGANLLSANPRTRQSFHAMRGHAVVSADANHHLLEIANVLMHIASVRTQIEDRVSDDLSGAVIGHIAAATGFVHLYAVHCKLPFGGCDMRTAVMPDAEGNHGWMLEQEQHIGNAAGTTLFDECLLQFERLGIGNKAKAAYLQDPGPRRAGISSRWRQSTPGVASRRP